MLVSKWTARLLAILMLSLVGCSQRLESVSLIVSGDTKGWITPCGCAANQSGGLARRATLLDLERKKSDVLYLDAGGSSIGSNEYQTTRLRYLLNGLNLAKLDGHNIGGPETQFAPDQLRQLGKQAGIQWVSSNLLDKNGQPIGARYLEFTRGSLKIAVAGVVDPELVTSDDWQVSNPTQAILAAFKDCQADVRVVLAYFDEKGLQELAQSLPEIDYLIGGPTGHALTARKVGNVTLMSSTNKGKFLTRAVLRKTANGFEQSEAEIVEVVSKIDEMPSQLKNLYAYYDELKQKDYAASDAGFVDASVVNAAGQRFSGSSSCAKCHANDDLVWQHSKHSHAWEPLVAKGAHFDPYCQQCHTTGYGQPGGFISVSQTKSIVGVGCENCHGPSQAHVENPKRKTPFLAKQQCTKCHDHENSPTFEMNAYWAKVLHAGNREPKTDEEKSL